MYTRIFGPEKSLISASHDHHKAIDDAIDRGYEVDDRGRLHYVVGEIRPRATVSLFVNSDPREVRGIDPV